MGDKLVVAVGQWGIETPWAWRASQSEKNLWDHMYDPLIMRDAKTFQYVPGLATEWGHSPDYKTWTFKLRQGVKFHGDWGEMTADDVKFTVEQNLKPDSQGGDAPFFRAQLDKIQAPDKYTVAMTFKTALWEVPSHFVQFNGYQNITSRKYLETVGEEKATQMPIGTGAYRYVDGRQGDYHRFAAVPGHWRVPNPGFKEIVIRRIPDPSTRAAGLRSGEIDIGQVAGDFLDQAKKAGLRIHEAKDAAGYWIVLVGQTTSDREDYCPQCPWAGDPNDPKSLANALKVRQAMNLAVNKKAIMDGLWRGMGSDTPYMYWYYPFNKGYDANWKLPPYDPRKAKQLLAEAGYPNGFEIRVNPMVHTFANDGPDVIEAVALDWEKVGIKSKRVPEDMANFLAKNRARKLGLAAWTYGSPPFDEPSLVWQRCIWSKGVFNILAEGPFDQDLDAIFQQLDPDKRVKLTHDLAQKLYDGYYGVMLGMKSTTWAVSKKVGTWPTLQAPLETNYEYITFSGQQ
ncbi:MAG: ABC transporter substrate-binding protein [Chloroflexi bacterium]|nr:ABC transporter substrate-binding protein [Chloroflexota bacterium]